VAWRRFGVGMVGQQSGEKGSQPRACRDMLALAVGLEEMVMGVYVVVDELFCFDEELSCSVEHGNVKVIEPR
jgi:hypothetical protein